ncbi:hypothetical protein D9613_008400 [Agrocybe pediades]|uniref:Uncharacterized protein n=1 Tax=Agrocybe pediades TaxID=84607 RepID=A0A8H4QTX1_9AGAR|nr:hypothetical protein D9613_008400 [Agrocybe pediades]
MVNIDNAIFPALSIISAHLSKFEPFPFPAGFDIQKVASAAQSLPEHSWEFGAAAQALLELHNPELSVFGVQPFPVPSISNLTSVPALKYAADSVKFGASYHALAKGDGAAGDPPSLGVSAVMLGKTDARFAKAADETVGGLFNDVPRFANGAISHRADVPELWADWMYMVPPFLAYYAVDKGDQALLQETINQITLYRQVLSPNPRPPPPKACGCTSSDLRAKTQATGQQATRGQQQG